MITLGLIEDSKMEFERWSDLAEKSTIECQIIWFRNPDEFLQSDQSVDILIVDRSLESEAGEIDIITSGIIKDIKAKYSGPTVYSSECPLFKDERHLFDLALKGKRIKSIEVLMDKLGLG